jgi:hypothetical protein
MLKLKKQVNIVNCLLKKKKVITTTKGQGIVPTLIFIKGTDNILSIP